MKNIFSDSYHTLKGCDVSRLYFAKDSCRFVVVSSGDNLAPAKGWNWIVYNVSVLGPMLVYQSQAKTKQF